MLYTSVGGQEPAEEEEIGKFCEVRFGVTFPLMAKSEVNGDNTHPVYQYLKSEKKQMFMERIKWNFEVRRLSKWCLRSVDSCEGRRMGGVGEGWG